MTKPKRFIPLLVASAIAALAPLAASAADIAGLTPRAEGWLVKSSRDIAIDPVPANLQGETDALKAIVAKRSKEDLARFKWWSVGGPVYRWNEIVIEEVQDAFVTLPLVARHLALFHAALDDAIATSQRHRAAAYRVRGQAVDAALTSKLTPAALAPSDYAAVATAAAGVLGYLFPARADVYAAKAEAAIQSRLSAGVEFPYEANAGRAIGRQVVALAIARGKSDRSDAKWDGAVPTMDGQWKSAAPPIAPAAASWQPWLLAHPSELRPAAPPAVGSDRFKTDMAELKAFQRTPKSNHRATYWEVFGGARAHSLWNEVTRTKLMEYNVAAEVAARVLAVMNIAFADAGVACWDAKYVYWYPRPGMVDPEFKSVFPSPNHPSYPSAHSCFSTSAATVLSRLFPADAERILAIGKEASEARIWAGIHYRFDLEAGQEIGRKAGDKALARGFIGRTN
ncbi:phosphatase PAP2 family protein [Ferrovibrio terrae]|uniref:Phosphatase PAP2 family protein n=1 Tax=Ferrovibrio terrae TaxID=2594003 RepID=A0A516GZR1_9PROT|nr:vanadium-dependent haloperoxidase [Ferrovibrio terrae]QDO97003.1 phosphatase PAP2 family protein [Ferrovibrio terrae]